MDKTYVQVHYLTAERAVMYLEMHLAHLNSIKKNAPSSAIVDLKYLIKELQGKK
ncbi:MAG: hypothetical protein RR370_03145 [Synergistaceae bacterium]